MVAYSLGANRNASDIDGGGTELDTGDTWTTNAYTLTYDTSWTKNKSGNGSVSGTGGFINEAGVDCEWDANTTLSVLGWAEIRGTSGSGVSYTGDLNYINTNIGVTQIDYLTYISDNYGLITNYGHLYVFNSTITAGTFMYFYYSATVYFENSSLSGTSGNGTVDVYKSTDLWLVDTTITNTHGNNRWGFTESGGKNTIHIVGTTNIEGAECNETNFRSTGINYVRFYYYSRIKTTIDDGTNPLTDAMMGIYHKVDKGHVIYSLASIYPPNFYGGRYKENFTDASGIVRCFALSKMYIESAWIYISDENQAETGDNAPYLVNAMYPNYQSPSTNTEAWGIETGKGNLDETDVGTLSASPITASADVILPISVTITEPNLTVVIDL